MQTSIGGRPVRIGGIAKGSGMIHPNMATMLGVITTGRCGRALPLARHPAAWRGQELQSGESLTEMLLVSIKNILPRRVQPCS